MSYKSLIFFVLILWQAFAAASDWRVKFTVTNHGSEGAQITNWAYFGEAANAADGYDYYNDLLLMSPPSGSPYIAPYFPHSDWGINNGNFVKDIRSNNPTNKTWNTTIKVQNRLSNNFTLSWEFIDDIPDYYSPIMVFGTQSINILEQSSFNYTSAATLTNLTLTVDYNSLVPYSLAEIPDLTFSDNQSQSLNLNRYFRVGSGTLSFTCSPDDNLIQDIVSNGDSVYWVLYPVPGWQGITTVEINAINGINISSQSVVVQRDNTNSPPVLQQALPTLQVTQNQSVNWDWTSYFADPDLDSLSISVMDCEHISVQASVNPGEITISPSEGYKGNLNLTLLVFDGHNEAPAFPIELQVLPSQPQQVQNVRFSFEDPASLLCEWDPVVQDISGNAISDLVYNVYIYQEYPLSEAAALVFNSITDTHVVVPAEWAKAFIVITAKNE
ncbi:MAG: Ig-like domain-containing protein [Candidatus Cloacimonetes bacterium]|jgi:hypothetical protein|nr:Ig-like domain-containing protein [Candidatus Cloacimonadota bacterium]MDY0336365.1 Ig-like domain-containing protein [Candidatus Cloacimonadaceae bacterium]MCB5268848.1 Ig-like domain-containing protein [Candidatus Cloacimonadota bacterium]MCK9333835.1 Ig-like domain-containing protein [Candidatus Cloacimonadota bacterium]MDD2683185.1 Ig-like domain-containing protein [Candidatus Cloacimonadota bacterium]